MSASHSGSGHYLALVNRDRSSTYDSVIVTEFLNTTNRCLSFFYATVHTGTAWDSLQSADISVTAHNEGLDVNLDTGDMLVGDDAWLVNAPPSVAVLERDWRRLEVPGLPPGVNQLIINVRLNGIGTVVLMDDIKVDTCQHLGEFI